VAPARKKRPATKSNVSAAPPPKKKASEKKQAIIPKKLSYDQMTDAEINAAVKSDVDSFFKKLKTEREAKRNPEKPYLLLRPEDLRQRVEAEQKKRREAQKESSSLSDYDRTLRKSIEEEKKKEKRARKGLGWVRAETPSRVECSTFKAHLTSVGSTADTGQQFVWLLCVRVYDGVCQKN
jgi:hypothetical protein